MKTNLKRSVLAYVPGLNTNAVLQLIIFYALLYVIIGLIWSIIMTCCPTDVYFNIYVLSNIGLPNKALFFPHLWTLFTYSWFEGNFWEMLTNMLWLYMFGSVVQGFVGYKQVIPLFIYCAIAGGVFYLMSQFIPQTTSDGYVFFGKTYNVIFGPRAALVGMAAAAVTLTPQYRFFFTESFRIQLWIVALIFFFLMVLSSGFSFPSVFLLFGGGGMGFLYIKLLQSGYKPGIWMYDAIENIESWVTPKENILHKSRMIKPKNEKAMNIPLNSKISSKRIDDILDKINDTGFNSLTEEEKHILMQAGKN